MPPPKALFSAWQRLQIRSLTNLSSLRCFATAPGNIGAIKELREKSGAPIAEVKAALEEAEYDADKAFSVLRKRGLAAATKKASRRAAEGLVGLAKQGGRAAVLVEVNSETDFVAKTEQFRSLVLSAAQAALRMGSHAEAGPLGSQIAVEALGSQSTATGSSVGELVQDVASSLRENIRIRRARRLEAPNGVLASYLHSSPEPGLGCIGTLVAIEGAPGKPLSERAAKLAQEAGNKLAMHAAASRPLYLNPETVPETAIEAEKSILREQAAKTGKPANIIEKMILGRLNKFYEEVCFLDQSFIMDDALKVKDVLKQLSKEAEAPLAITGFVRLQCGEGLEEEAKKSFSAEVREAVEQTLAACG